MMSIFLLLLEQWDKFFAVSILETDFSQITTVEIAFLKRKKKVKEKSRWKTQKKVEVCQCLWIRIIVWHTWNLVIVRDDLKSLKIERIKKDFEEKEVVKVVFKDNFKVQAQLDT